MGGLYVILSNLLAIIPLCVALANPKNWVINFKNDAEISTSNFEDVEKWIAANNGKVVDKLNSNEYKVIIAEMDDKIRNILNFTLILDELLKDEQVGQYLESIEDDDDYEHEDL
jgi:hypothetical protein